MTDKPENNSTEAPASVTYDVESKNGFTMLFTVRGTSGLELLDVMDSIEAKLIAKEYKPHIKQSWGAKKETEYVDGKVCLEDGGRLKIIHAKDGKTYWGCENSRYDAATKTKSGCKGFYVPEKYDMLKRAKTQGTLPVEEFDDWTQTNTS